MYRSQKDIIDLAQKFEFGPKWACACYAGFLKDKILEKKDFVSSVSRKFLFAKSDIDEEFIRLMVKEAENEIDRMEASVKRVMDFSVEKEITDNMIEAARDYPIDRLIDFKRRRAIAFCHNSDSFSMSHMVNANMAHCFVCNKSFNPIDVLMERDGMTFMQAVKHLC